MVENIEIERRFLVLSDPHPDLWGITSRTYIRQDYLKTITEGVTERVRFSAGPQVVYTHTVKSPRAQGKEGMNEEEIEISWVQYNTFLRFRDPNCQAIYKDRYTFTWEGRVFELDVFLETLKPLMILEVELPSLDTPVEIPPFFPHMLEITGEKIWSNASLARKGQPQASVCGACGGQGWVGFSMCHICGIPL